MKVIMTSDVEKLGNRGEIVEVAKGYFNNYLLPNKMALLATKSNLKNLDATIKNAILRDKKQKTNIEEIAKTLKAKDYILKAKCGPSGKLFGSITSADIAKIIRSNTKIDVDKRKIVMVDSIKTIGDHEVALKLHPEVEINLKLVVEAEA